ncbi:hypothetical protein SAMN02745221_01460 [Thermosyntropha lipolytica DSM 11003]|uniref:Glycoside hydrolase family 57 N-terminal domain-containing protein n=1 Tax=Thermosyntropha lipolytica DSM 11003 TaxID=1123382 RepID=A0A1M5PFD0_9FIRM|nr:hypothetical protein [Thermosyntropha lipolytica]SHH00455.1 hypothetical protein SAMN02745221_01460 [Thermosyntropha lipolytica DSM 11003]
MKGYVAFCPHFHQPHFQLYKTREEAYKNSYEPWLSLLQAFADKEGFFINLHFSGPFLYWIEKEKPQFILGMKELIKRGKAGLIGGLADEPFIQLTSRRDDFFYQIKKYEELTQKLFEVGADEWQGIHIVEREGGEFLLQELSYAARKLGAFPLYYLDAETFYNSHFAYPGSESDYCLKHFGFKDPYSRTTMSHIPQEMLFFALRDEIGGQEYFALPVHSKYRYHLLKRGAFTREDKNITKPVHYYFYIKDALERAGELGEKWGKKIEPILVIFEDAEKFGQWSKDPQGDAKWLEEFFHLVLQDEELAFIGIKDYVLAHGFLDTYPARSSHSYTEWENWTAKRGIRGVVFGDERLRLVLNRLRDVEKKQRQIEEHVISLFSARIFADKMPDDSIQDMYKNAVLNSAERYEIVQRLLELNFSASLALGYQLVNRVRHVVYQEDPKWASRHPSYGSSPYYDMQGLAYLFMAERLLQYMEEALNLVRDEEGLEIKDWDYDGLEEIVIRNKEQFLVIDLKGGCISFHQVLDNKVSCDPDVMKRILERDIDSVAPYNDIYRISIPLIFTETDSRMACSFYPEGGRKETCRHSMRCEIEMEREGEYTVLGNLATVQYKIDEIDKKEDEIRIKLLAEEKIRLEDGDEYNITLTKEFRIDQKGVKCAFKAFCSPENSRIRFFLVPDIAASVSPSDEIDFKPQAWVQIESGGEREILYHLEDKQLREGENISLIDESFVFNEPGDMSYYYRIKSAKGECFINRVNYRLSAGENIEKVVISPAVKNYYQGYVNDEQSRLGYHTSGLAVKPKIAFKDGEAFLKVDISWEFDVKWEADPKAKVVELLAYPK